MTTDVLSLRFRHSRHMLQVRDSRASLDVLAFEGENTLCKPFRYCIEFTRPDHHVTRENMLMRTASKTLQVPGTAHQLMASLSGVLLKYEPRLRQVMVVMPEQTPPGELRYAIDADLKNVGQVCYDTTSMPEGIIMHRYLNQQGKVSWHGPY